VLIVNSPRNRPREVSNSGDYERKNHAGKPAFMRVVGELQVRLRGEKSRVDATIRRLRPNPPRPRPKRSKNPHDGGARGSVRGGTYRGTVRTTPYKLLGATSTVRALGCDGPAAVRSPGPAPQYCAKPAAARVCALYWSVGIVRCGRSQLRVNYPLKRSVWV
jgi:hypothetical protein